MINLEMKLRSWSRDVKNIHFIYFKLSLTKNQEKGLADLPLRFPARYYTVHFSQTRSFVRDAAFRNKWRMSRILQNNIFCFVTVHCLAQAVKTSKPEYKPVNNGKPYHHVGIFCMVTLYAPGATLMWTVILWDINASFLHFNVRKTRKRQARKLPGPAEKEINKSGYFYQSRANEFKRPLGVQCTAQRPDQLKLFVWF